jgi:hypothetical protein
VSAAVALALAVALELELEEPAAVEEPAAGQA